MSEKHRNAEKLMPQSRKLPRRLKLPIMIMPNRAMLPERPQHRYRIITAVQMHAVRMPEIPRLGTARMAVLSLRKRLPTE